MQQRYQPRPPPVRVANGSPSHLSNSGNEEILDGSGSGHQTPLSATVPEFKPEGRLAAKANETSINEERIMGTKIDDLSIIVGKPDAQACCGFARTKFQDGKANEMIVSNDSDRVGFW